jgi:histidinol-phosphate aminotransferase
MAKYPVTQVVAKLPASVPFVGPEIQEREIGKPFDLRLGANENGLGPSPKALAAMREALPEIWMYGDSVCYEIRQKLAEIHQVGMENIVVGEGIDALLGYTCRLFVEPGRNVVTTTGAYPTFNFHVSGNGGDLHFVPMKGHHEDIDGILSKSTSVGAHLSYFSNPNNPMGSWHDASEMQRLIDGFEGNNILVLDEAYMEFAPEGTAPAFDVSNANLLRFRTFSKAYAMAGARIGYCIGEAGLISEFEKVRNHFGVSRVSQAGALASLNDQAYLQETLGKVVKGREKIAGIADKYGFKALPSATNFVAIDTRRDEQFARAIVDRLTGKAVFIRMPSIAPDIGFIRVSVGSEEELDQFDQVLGEVLAELV